MPQARLEAPTGGRWFAPCLATLLLLCQGGCSHDLPTASSNGGTGGGLSSGKAGATGGPSASGGSSVSGGAGAAGSVGGVLGTAGTTGPGAAAGTAGASSGARGTGGGTGGGIAGGGATGVAGATAAGGSRGSGGSVGGQSGATPTGGTSAPGGSTGTGATAGSGVPKDQSGMPLATPGQCTSTTRQYLNLGDLRLINNRWGSDARSCGGTMQKVCVNADGSVGWSFTRPGCGGDRAYPDFPEVEFGVAPFGSQSANLTTPPFSSTTLLPIQLKDLSSATLDMDSFTTSIPANQYWNSNFEFWISKQDPTKNGDAGVYAEIIVFLGWQANRQSSTGGWPCMVSGMVNGTNYNLCHQSDDWSSGHWRFFNFIVGNGPLSSFSGKVDIKLVLDWIRSKYSGFTSDMWLTRIEVGTEIDDDTQGSANIKNLTFEINGASKSIQLAR